MPDDITQKLGFDASKAIQELTKLRNELSNFRRGLEATAGALRKFPTNATPAIQAMRQLAMEANNARVAVSGLATAGGPATAQVGTAVAQSFNQATQALEQTGKAAKGAASATAQGSQQVATNANAMGNALQNAGRRGAAALNGITVSWTTVARIVQAQVIVRAISQVVSALSNAREEAEQFSIAVAEAFTISGGELGTMEELNQKVRDLARTLGESADEVAEGLYQTLSNQVTEAGDALRFEEQAAKLSIATHSELKDAVNALSSVMNSYNLDVSETERVSDVLFKTIELGRLRLGEFGSVLGRLTPLTAELGIGYEEMAAAVAAITQKGVPAHTALTQLTQVSNKLLRPTTALQELYDKWGVESGPEAIRTFGGLAGVLTKMQEETRGSSTEFADLLGRVRATVGALNLTTNEAEAFTSAIDAMANSAGVTEKALEEIRSAAGREAVEAWNNLATSMLSVGDTLLAITTPLAQGLDVIVQHLDDLTVIAAGTAAGLIGMKLAAIGFTASLNASTAAAVRLGVVLKANLPLLLAVAAAAATVAIANVVKDSLDSLEELNEETRRSEAELTRIHEEHAQRRTQQTRKEFAERRQLTGQFYAEATLAYKKDFSAIAATSKAITDVLSESLSDIFKQRQAGIDELVKAGTDADKVMQESMKVVAKAQATLNEMSFKQETRHLSERQKLWAQIERAQDEAAKSRSQYAKAGSSEEALAAAREQSNIAEKRAQEALATAEKLGGIANIRTAEEELRKVLNDRIKAELSLQVEREKTQTAAHKERLKQLDQEGKKAENLAETIAELLDPFADGERKKPSQIEADLEQAKALIPELEQSLDAAFDFGIFEKLNIQEGMDRLKAGVTAAFQDARINWDRAIDDLQARLNQRALSAPVTLQITNEEVIGRIEEQFGERDPLGDVFGKQAAQTEEALEGIVTQYEDNADRINNITTDVSATLNDVFRRIDPDNWFNWWDRLKASAATASDDMARAEGVVTGSTERMTASARLAATEAGKIQQKLSDVAAIVKTAFVEQRALTEAELESVTAIRDYGRELEATGSLHQRFSAQGAIAFEKLVKAVNLLIEREQLRKENLELTDPYEASVQALDKSKQAAEEAVEAQKNMAGAAEASAQAIRNEADQAERLKTALQNAAISKTAAQPTEAVAQPTQAAPVSVDAQRAVTTEFQAQNREADLLNTKIQAVQTSVGLVNPYVQQTSDSLSKATSAAAAAKDNAGLMVNPFMEVQGAATSAAAATADVNTQTNLAVAATNSLAVSTGNWNNQLNNSVAAANAASAAMQNTAAAAVQAAEACAQASGYCSGGAVTAAKGGRFFAIGGRGTDTIPAMLSPGEFVINARSARNFFPQLQAINAGQQPVYREQGGSVTNVGDINVTVQGGDNSQQTIREIANGLRREISRGTIKLT